MWSGEPKAGTHKVVRSRAARGAKPGTSAKTIEGKINPKLVQKHNAGVIKGECRNYECALHATANPKIWLW